MSLLTIGRLEVRRSPYKQRGFFRTWTWGNNGRTVRFGRVLFIWRGAEHAWVRNG